MSYNSDIYDDGDNIADRAAKNPDFSGEIPDFDPNKPDFSKTPYIECKDLETGDTLKFTVSPNGYLQLTKDILQLNTESPVGQFIMNRWPNINPGDIISPAGYEITFVGTYQLPDNFKPL